MVLFINDRPIRLVSLSDFYLPESNQTVVDLQEEQFDPIQLFGRIFYKNADEVFLTSFIQHVQKNKRTHFTEIVMEVKNIEDAKDQVKRLYTIVNAAGGVVHNKKDQILLIHRLGVWDLPKGKLEKKEKWKKAAVREVEEECNIRVKLQEKVGTTWHTYTHNGKNILKRTKWYRMLCLDDSKMSPQLEEDIDDIKWMDGENLLTAMEKSYLSIAYILKKAGVLPLIRKSF